MFQLIDMNFLKFVQIGSRTMDYINFAFWYLWVCDDLMSLHPRFIE